VDTIGQEQLRRHVLGPPTCYEWGVSQRYLGYFAGEFEVAHLQYAILVHEEVAGP
jgi:hypothetical protein